MRAAPPTPPAMAELAGEELEFFDGMIQRCIEIEHPHREAGRACLLLIYSQGNTLPPSALPCLRASDGSRQLALLTAAELLAVSESRSPSSSPAILHRPPARAHRQNRLRQP